MTIIRLPGHGLSNSAAGRSKHWIKRLDGVDTSRDNGYAFTGQFARFEGRVEAAEGTHYLSYVEDVTGAGRLYGRDVRLLRVTNGDLAEVKHWRLGPESGWALAVRDEVAALMAQPASVDELLAERERLLARLAEIDAQLPEPAGVEVDTRAAAQALGVSVRTVQRWAATGKVAASKDAAGRWVITITISTNDA